MQIFVKRKQNRSGYINIKYTSEQTKSPETEMAAVQWYKSQSTKKTEQS